MNHEGIATVSPLSHTPGPWRAVVGGVVEVQIDGEWCRLAEASGEAPRAGCLSAVARHAPTLRSTAAASIHSSNTRLIAAAPDMYHALLKLEAHHVSRNALAGRPETASTTLRLIREALASAERNMLSWSSRGNRS